QGEQGEQGEQHEHILSLIDEMAEQEQKHLDTFDKMIIEQDVRPTLLSPLWHIAGFTLGAATALMGARAAMACTAAVEAEIDAHYATQEKELTRTKEAPDLVKTITAFRADEAAHRQTALDNGASNGANKEDTENAEQALAFPILDRLIRTGCKVAIRLSEKI
ncbi:MAG: demethoxyubiquinone hydroxylase family protein, partial [Alphaproteobacteria bacterium]|nr:demethoxyubiquinone hydroxylase family protein [Alphaproteobacteria bacterium]